MELTRREFSQLHHLKISIKAFDPFWQEKYVLAIRILTGFHWTRRYERARLIPLTLHGSILLALLGGHGKSALGRAMDLPMFAKLSDMSLNIMMLLRMPRLVGQ